MVIKCKCSHPAQDKLHGEGNRVHTPRKETKEKVGARCTVCHKEIKLYK